MTQAEFNSMLQVAVAEGLPGGSFTMRYSWEEIEALLSGKGMEFLGRYDTVNDVPAPVDGGHYYIGSEPPYHVYTYINGNWVDAGTMQGPKGDKGDPFTYEDFTPEQLDDLERGAKAAQTAAETAAESAANSAGQASTSEQNAAGSASAASASETNAKASEVSAKASETATQASQTAAAESASAAANSAASASASASAASESASAAAASKTAAKSSEEASKASETAAKASETAAAESASAAQQSATSAAESAAVYDSVVSDVTQLKQDIEKMRFGDPYDGVDLTSKFSDEISGYTDPGAWIRARIRANNFDGIHVNDYIPFTTTHGLKFKARVAGIDTYYKYGNSAVGHHIDWICEELWPTLKPINPVNYNNGLIPTENITTDGTTAQYALTKPMYGVAKVTHGKVDLTGWTYDNESCTLSFSTAPDAGTITVTGAGSEHPWLASDAYLYVNSLAGHVANSTGVNPAIKRVDYTNDGIYHYLPDWLKNVIIEKRFLLTKRYSATGILSDDNSWSWTNIGKLWLPTEPEVYGMPVWGGKNGYSLGGSAVQYPIFMGNMNRLRYRNGSRYTWWLLSTSASSTGWCGVDSNGYADSSNASRTSVAAPVCFRIG